MQYNRRKITRYKSASRLNDYPHELRGPSNNRYGGHQNSRLKSYGGKFGPAGQTRTFSEQEKADWLAACLEREQTG